MRKKINFKPVLALLICTFCYINHCIAAGIDESDVNAQLRRLDKELEKREAYIGARKARIDSLRAKVDESTNGHDLKWHLSVMRLAESYNTFNIDSALCYYNKGLDSALKLGNDSLATSFRIHRAMIYPVVGFVKNALEEYESIDTTALPAGLKCLYHDGGRQMFSYISSFYIDYPTEHEKYLNRALKAQAELLACMQPDDPRYRLNLGEYFFARQEYTKAKVVLEELMESIDESENMFARASHFLGDIAKARGYDDEYVYYLSLSAISDIKSATLEVASLQELGKVMFARGDVKRAHRYLQLALDGAVDGHATMRLIQTAEAMPLIEEAHNIELGRERRRIYVVIGLLALLLVILIAFVWYIRREMMRMAELQEKLQTANNVKEVYISQFMSLCSIYMDKLHQFCKIANRKISAGQVEDLYRMTKSGKFVEEQSREFYEVFDDAFLHIYPTFVSSVNALLRPDEQIVLEDGEKLNTDLRILAFMRLGIEDSNKIAQVLNYSVNTIYTYRNKLKNRAICRDTFEQDIMKISSVN